MQEDCDGSLLTEQTACMPGSLRSKHIEMKRSGIEMTCFESSKNNKSDLYEVLKVQPSEIFLDSSMVEHSAVNRVVVGSSPTRGVFFYKDVYHLVREHIIEHGDLAKW